MRSSVNSITAKKNKKTSVDLIGWWRGERMMDRTKRTYWISLQTDRKKQ